MDNKLDYQFLTIQDSIYANEEKTKKIYSDFTMT